MPTIYEVRARRSGKWWALDVPGVPGAHSQVRRLEQAEAMAREAIALVLDVAPDSFSVAITPRLESAPELAAVISRAIAARTAVEEAQRAARAYTIAAIEAADEAGLTTRDTAELLDVSFQYVSKLHHQRSTAADEPDPATRGIRRIADTPRYGGSEMIAVSRSGPAFIWSVGSSGVAGNRCVEGSPAGIVGTPGEVVRDWTILTLALAWGEDIDDRLLNALELAVGQAVRTTESDGPARA